MIDETSAWLGALFAVSVILALVVVGIAYLAWVAKVWATAFLGHFRTMRMERLGGQLQITTAIVEPVTRAQPKLHLLPSSPEESAPEAAE